MRVTNIDTISAFIDRLIVENIKLYFFNKEDRNEEVNQQLVIISEIKKKLSDVILECILSGEYNYLSEKRTFDENAIVENIEELIKNNLNIGEGDRARLAEITKDTPNFDIVLANEKITRKSNEGRARNKNKIDEIFKWLLNK